LPEIRLTAAFQPTAMAHAFRMCSCEQSLTVRCSAKIVKILQNAKAFKIMRTGSRAETNSTNANKTICVFVQSLNERPKFVLFIADSVQNGLTAPGLGKNQSRLNRTLSHESDSIFIPIHEVIVASIYCLFNAVIKASFRQSNSDLLLFFVKGENL
jgi:hypothetical protein